MTNRPSQPEAWFAKADHDLLAIEQLMAAPTVVWDIVAFHAQQAAEKYLKGYLVSRGGHVPRIHDLATLLTRCCSHDETLGTFASACERLSRLGWLSRYPDPPEEPSEADIRAGVDTSREIRRAIRQRTGPRHPGDDTSR
jgi:HEPN domain-containing protein